MVDCCKYRYVILFIFGCVCACVCGGTSSIFWKYNASRLNKRWPLFLEASTREEQIALICFLGGEGEELVDIHHRMKRQNGDMCVWLQQVYMNDTGRWLSNLADASLSSRPHTESKPDANGEVERMIREDRRITVVDVAGGLKTGHGYGSTQNIIHEVLQCRNVSARCVSKQLSPDIKRGREDICERPLLRLCETEGDDFLSLEMLGTLLSAKQETNQQ